MYHIPPPRFQERFSSHIPAMVLLNNLGWEFLSREEALVLRNNDRSAVVLGTVLREVLAERTFAYGGKHYPLSQTSINKLVDTLTQPNLSEGLLQANEHIYHQLLLGITVSEFIDGKKINLTIPIIDWQNPQNNRFHFSEEFSVNNPKGTERRPDLVCFVNGIPLSVIEAKRPQGKKTPTIEEGISQHLRNQRIDEIPHLFAYSQLLLSISGTQARYATVGTPAKFWAAWREEDLPESAMQAVKNAQKFAKILPHLSQKEADWLTSLSASTQHISEQDKLIISLLSPERLLEMVQYFILFDKKFGKIVARYQQVFGIKRLIERICRIDQKGKREGGVIWHTTGSGKSFTMVLLSKALILHPKLKQCRVIVITDRIDLEKQLSRTFANSGELASKKELQSALVKRGTELAHKIGKGTERIIFSLIQKFQSAVKLPECHNDSNNIIVLIDEGHRSQQGENNALMQQALPNASFVAFTGTPLLKEQKTTNKFGSIIHAYTMQRAVEDGAVTPLLYEERILELDVNAKAIDSWFERITQPLNDSQKADLKRKFARKGQIYTADDRIHLIALDIIAHFNQHIDAGLKGQLACDSKQSAIKYQQYFAENGFETAVVISPPDSREGNLDLNEEEIPLVQKWWKENVGNQDESLYTQAVIKRFEQDPDLKLLIVVDKLLTGFDEPKNAVLYIDKPLKEHNLIQAVARVNRLHDQKKFGLLIDYRGILKELDTTIADYQHLAEQTQGGYDVVDIAGLYRQVANEYARLPELYRKLWAIFADVQNKQDIEALRAVLMPRFKASNGEQIDQNQPVRDSFYSALTEFASCLKVAFQSVSFFDDVSESQRQHYKETLKQMTALRQLAQEDAGEKINYDSYADAIKKLMDKHISGIAVREPTAVYDVSKFGKKAKNTPQKTRNEADKIRSQLTHQIDTMIDDPYARARFSELLQEVITQAELAFDYPDKQLLLFQQFAEQVQQRKLPELPDFGNNRFAQAYYGVVKMHLPESAVQMGQIWADFAKQADEIVNQCVQAYSINPTLIETEIRKQLLPKVFMLCKDIGGGMEHAKRIVEGIVQIVRVGL
ncbi:type I restriction endonuclease subunit R [Actinobacillus vicugnae]|uniref:type I restriction endonuclease subunit R n=1 Tax=Actinobacillus vicugnae TaxID=2573093 RepID=UPI0012429968|nr:HsdR family type I site-specific deoxyribonuclease [Actinobacillus vicugnae]